MLINLRNALMAGKRLPYDSEVEYLESTGTEYIDTGVVPTTTKTEITFSTPTPPSSGYMCGSFNANNNRYYPAVFSGSSTKYINLINAANTVISQHINDGNVHTVVYNATGGACYFDGESAGTLSTTTLTASNPIYLFRASVASGLVSGRIYSCKLWDANGTLVRDYIPVRKGTVGYLYDRVSGKLFGNAGTGDFVVGQDVVPVEYLDNTGGTAYIDSGYVFKTKPRVVTNCSINGGVDRDLFGTGEVSASCFIFDIYLGATNWLYYRYASTSAINASAGAEKPQVGIKCRIDASDKVYIDDILSATRTGTYDFSQNTSSLKIFASRNVHSAKIYDFTMWDNDELVRKFLPVRVGTDATSWEGAMMDTLTRRIYRNAGTGAFAYGNDLKYPIPSE